MVEVRAVEPVAIAALVLGAVQRKIGLHHHGLRAACLGRKQRDADARRDADSVVLDDEGLRERLADPRRERARSVGIGHVDTRMANSSPPKRATTIIWPHSPLEPADGFLQQKVAHGMAKRVVHVFEVVYAEIENGEARRATPAQSGTARIALVTRLL
ncbi:MAG TPA: hypothetical protein VK984_05035 [Methyloceanibacter sp.]|nr:hypothetical protein [Methyloceanibacter sp.]